MRKDHQKEEVFLEKIKKKEFNFSYSSLNRLMFAPSLFYKDYILQDKEHRTDKHLIAGKLIHLLLLQPEEFDNQFVLMPSKMPSDSLRKVLKNITLYTDAVMLGSVQDDLILDSLKEVGLYQSLKDEDKRVAKVRSLECEEYFAFAATSDKDVVDQETFTKCTESVELIKNNKDVFALLKDEPTDFEMDNLEVFNEAFLDCTLENYSFGLKGVVDRYTIDHNTKTVKIIDLKTTGKTIADFPETVQFYKYWLQAAVYMVLVTKNLDKKIADYKISFNFIVIDKYNQIYAFPVKQATLSDWGMGMTDILDAAEYHVKENRYDLPYMFLKDKPSL
jgi:hypothetical protein|tara:strand:+ start:609 stop:1607 length:999 start_codon:yes stop_codon:yes gene_type:complete